MRKRNGDDNSPRSSSHVGRKYWVERIYEKVNFNPWLKKTGQNCHECNG